MSFSIRKIIKSLIQQQFKWCTAFDLILPVKFRLDGNEFFNSNFTPKYLHKEQLVYDIGGGKTPYFSKSIKDRYALNIVGLDIDRNELDQAQEGIYDRVIVSDIAIFNGSGDGDLVICEAVLEHVEDVNSAIGAISSCLKPGGIALIFVPSRNALFSRLNLILPESLKREILKLIFDKKYDLHGFKSYYNNCTPKQFKKIAKKNNLNLIEESHHYISVYFQVFLPIYIIWRVWILLFYLFKRENAAETFCMAFQKEEVDS